jgi:tetratricopeptide (TPR) repeat protein
MLIGTVAGERLTYGASLWFALGISFLIWKLLRLPDETADTTKSIFETKNVATFTAILAVLILAASYRTFVRNPVWKDSNTLFISDKDSAPNSFRSTRAAGEQYFLQYINNQNAPGADKVLEQARVCFAKSDSIRPTENAFVGLGNVDFFRKKYATAAEKFKKALELKPNNKLATDRLSATYIEWGKYEGQTKQDYPAAVACMLEGLKLFPKNQLLLRQIGTAYGLQNKHQEAIHYYEIALEQAPGDKDLLRNLSIGYRLLGDLSKSDAYARQIGQ